jgi:phenylalanine-4-hydroxylase
MAMDTSSGEVAGEVAVQQVNVAGEVAPGEEKAVATIMTQTQVAQAAQLETQAQTELCMMQITLLAAVADEFIMDQMEQVTLQQQMPAVAAVQRAVEQQL